MANPAYPRASTLSQRDVAIRLINRSARLLRLLDVDAPQIIIERERQLVADALAAWPVHDQAAHEEAVRGAKT